MKEPNLWTRRSSSCGPLRFSHLPMADSWKFETLDVQRDVATGGLWLRYAAMGIQDLGLSWYPNSWIVYFKKHPTKMDDARGYPYFRKAPFQNAKSTLDSCKHFDNCIFSRLLENAGNIFKEYVFIHRCFSAHIEGDLILELQVTQFETDEQLQLEAPMFTRELHRSDHHVSCHTSEPSHMN